MKQLTVLGKEELVHEAKKLQAPLELVEWVAEHGKLPVPNFSAGGIATPADAALVMQLGAEAVFVGSGIFKSSDPEARAEAIVKAAKNYNDPGKLLEASRELGDAMPGLEISKMPESRAAADPRLVDETQSECWLAAEGISQSTHVARRFRGARTRAGARRRSPSTSANREQLDGLDGLIIPGGESTTMLKLLRYEDLMEPLCRIRPAQADVRHLRGRDPDGNEVTNPAQESLGLMDIAVERNAYGRQIDSRVAEIEPEPEFQQRTAPGKLEAVFIRAPIIRGRRAGGAGAGAVQRRSGAGGTGQASGRDLPSGTHARFTRAPVFLEKL